LGPEDPQTLRARVLQTIVHRVRGRTREMRGELDELIPALRRSRRADPQHLIRALRNSANLAIHEGRYPAAEADASEATEPSIHRYGEPHPETATSSRVLALARLHSGKPELPLETAERAFRLTLAVHGGDAQHPGVSEARSFYGRALARMGRFDEC